MVGVPMGSDAFAVNSALEIVRHGGAEQLACILLRMPDKQSANLIATSAMVESNGPGAVTTRVSAGRH